MSHIMRILLYPILLGRKASRFGPTFDCLHASLSSILAGASCDALAASGSAQAILRRFLGEEPLFDAAPLSLTRLLHQHLLR